MNTKTLKILALLQEEFSSFSLNFLKSVVICKWDIMYDIVLLYTLDWLSVVHVKL